MIPQDSPENMVGRPGFLYLKGLNRLCLITGGEINVKHYEIQDLDKKSDERGWLIEVLGGQLPEGCREFGQLHVSVAYPGKVRGNHYHTRNVEWFCVPTGTGKILLKDKETGETQEFIVGVNDLKTIKIEPGTIHAIKNIGEEDMVLLVYANEKFDPKDPDTYYEKILE